MRMFAAVVPPNEVVDELDDFLSSRRESGDFRWTSPESWHVTLAFMADVPDRSLEDLEERLARAARRRSPFTLTVGGGGAFPDVARARLLYAGVAGDDADGEELRRLATGARAAASRAGAAPDGATFRPHLTLARTRRPTDVVRWARLLDTFGPHPWRVEELVLVQSFLGEGPRGRPRYETCGAWPLGSRSDD